MNKDDFEIENIRDIIVERDGYKEQVEELKNINDKLSNALNSAEQRIDDTTEYINFLIITTAGIQDELYSKCKLGMVRFNDTLWGKELLSILNGEDNE